MEFRFPSAIGLIACVLLAVQAVVATAQPDPSRPPGVTYIGTVPDTGQFLPDSAIVGRFEDIKITVGEFVEAYFNSYAQFRPPPDSAGRVQFLESMIRKEILAHIAWEVDRPLTFEDRVLLAGDRERLLSNVLFQRMVMDSIVISERDVQAVYAQHLRQIRLRHILVSDLATAARVRSDLIAGRISWPAAVKKYSRSHVADPEGELGWTLRTGKPAEVADQLWSLREGEITQPVQDEDGIHLIQLIESRPYEAPSLEALRSQIENDLRQAQIARLSQRLQGRLAQQAGMTYDTLQIKAAVALMPEPPDQSQTLVIDMTTPHVSDEDTARVLARYRDRTVTLGQILASYSQINPLVRQPLNSFNAMVGQIQAVGLESYRADLARTLRLEDDPQFLQQMRRREEQLRVEHLYQDSVLSKVWVPSEDRRAHYEARKHDFVTYATVRFAAIYAPSRSGADSLAERLRSGERAEDILTADESRGVQRGSIQERRQNQEGYPYHTLLFEVLREGEVSVEGPDDQSGYAVIQLLAHDPGRQLSYEESVNMIDESLQNMASEKLLKELVARHRPRFDIEMHPERMMLVRLVDPLL